MRSDAARADRAEEVRRAARAWRRAGLIDDAELAALDARHPDDRVRATRAFRVLFFVFTLIAFCGVFGFVAIAAEAAHPSEGFLAFLLLAVGAAMTAVTEWLVGPLRRRHGGIESATSLLAVSCVLSGGAWLVTSATGLRVEAHLGLLAVGAAALLAAAAWRWGYALYAAAGALCLFVALARLPHGRLLWIAVPLAAAVPLLRLGRSARLPPALRSAATAVFLVAMAALYAAVHLDSWEHRWVEALAPHEAGSELSGEAARGDPSAGTAASGDPYGAAARGDTSGAAASGGLAPSLGRAWWWLAAAGTVLVPVGLLVAGLRRRRLAVALAGALGAVIALLTFYQRVHPLPAWLALTLAGGATIGLALGLWRWLDAGPAGERHGYTAASLGGDARRQAALEIGGVALTMPAAQPHAAEPASGFQGAGGRAGGAGASGEF